MVFVSGYSYKCEITVTGADYHRIIISCPLLLFRDHILVRFLFKVSLFSILQSFMLGLWKWDLLQPGRLLMLPEIFSDSDAEKQDCLWKSFSACWFLNSKSSYPQTEVSLCRKNTENWAWKIFNQKCLIWCLLNKSSCHEYVERWFLTSGTGNTKRIKLE